MNFRSRIIWRVGFSVLLLAPLLARGATVSATPGAYSAQGNAIAVETSTLDPVVTVVLRAEYGFNDTAQLTISGAEFFAGTPESVTCINPTNGLSLTFAGLLRTATAASYRVVSTPPFGLPTAGMECSFQNPISRRSAITPGPISVVWTARSAFFDTPIDTPIDEAEGNSAVVARVVDQFPAPSNVTVLNGIVDVVESRYQFTSASDDNAASVGSQDRLSFTLVNNADSNGAVTLNSIVARITGDFSFIDNNGTAGCQAADLSSGHGRVSRRTGSGTLTIDASCRTLTYTTSTAEAVSIELGTSNPRGTAPASTWRVLPAPQAFLGTVQYSFSTAGGTALDQESFAAGGWTLSTSAVNQPPSISDFDVLRYIASHPDLIAVFGTNIVNARKHYQDFASKEGRKITFEPLYYTASHPDLIAAFGVDEVKSVTHYIQSGYREGRTITFEPTRYMASHADLIQAFAGDERKAAAHFIQWGVREGRQTTFTDLDALQYIASQLDLIRAFGADVVAGIRHYVTFGYREGRRIVFDALAYIASYGDLIAAFATDAMAGVRHYINWGVNEGRRIIFDPQAYLAVPGNADVLAAFGANPQAATAHYINFGFREGRAISVAALPAVLSGGPLDFGSLVVGNTSAGRVLTLSNSGSVTLSGIVISISGNNQADFARSDNCTLSLAPGGSCVIIIRFAPLANSSAGGKSAAVRVTFANSGTVLTAALAGVAAPVSGVGDSATNPARDALALMTARPGVSSGFYWFDPDGSGGRAAFRTYADMSINGGGWMQVRRLAGSGGWYPDDDNLAGTVARSVDSALERNSETHWSHRFDYFIEPSTEFLFMTGDGLSWCVLRKGVDVFNGMSPLGVFGDRFRFSHASPVLASQGVGATEGEFTAVIMRTENREDPIISCERDITGGQELYREDSVFGAANSQFKNARGGINIFVRTRPGFATTAAHPARTAEEILRVDPAASSGWYWFDPDGSGPNAPFRAFADLATGGGGWLQVRRVPGFGGWYPVDDNLAGALARSPERALDSNSGTAWSHKFDYFVNNETEFMFKTGDGGSWCALRRANSFGSSTNVLTRGATVLGSSGVGVPAGGSTTVLLRHGFAEDPWIGCQGTHWDNQSAMLYGEGVGGNGSDHNAFKNARAGINVFVRQPQTLPIIVNLDAIANATTSTAGTAFASGSSAVRVQLPAGTYEIVPIGPAAGARYTAAEFCNCNISPRKYSFIYDFFTSESATRVRVQASGGSMDGGVNFTTAAGALAAAPVARVSLSTPGWISFFIHDSTIADNLGGVSLRIQTAGSRPTSTGLGLRSKFVESFSNGFEQRWTADPSTLVNDRDASAPATNRVTSQPRFETLSGVSVAILENKLAARESRYGFRAISPVRSPIAVEARFNTLTIGSNDIDGLIELSLINAADPSKYVVGMVYGGCFNGCKSINLRASGFPGYSSTRVEWAANTWYRLRLIMGSRPELQLWNDQKTSLLASALMPSAVSLGTEFYVGLSQRMGTPDRTHNLVVAIDTVEVE